MWGIGPHWLSDGEGEVGVYPTPVNIIQFEKKIKKNFREYFI